MIEGLLKATGGHVRYTSANSSETVRDNGRSG